MIFPISSTVKGRVGLGGTFDGYHEDPHHAISELGWINEQTHETGRSSRLAVYDWIKNRKGPTTCLRYPNADSQLGVHEKEEFAKWRKYRRTTPIPRSTRLSTETSTMITTIVLMENEFNRSIGRTAPGGNPAVTNVSSSARARRILPCV